MHKKIASELTSLAHEILQMKNKNDIVALKKKAYEIHEKLSVLAYVEKYINTTPQATETKEELLAKVETANERIALEKKQTITNKTELTNILKEEEEEEVKVVSTPIFKKPNEELIKEPVLKKEDTTTKPLERISIEDKKEVTQPPIFKNLNEEVVKEPSLKKEDTTTKPLEKTSIEDEKEVTQPPIFKNLNEEEVKEPSLKKEGVTKEPIEKTSTEEETTQEVIEQPFDAIENLFKDTNKKFDETSFKEKQKNKTLEEELEGTLSVDITADLFAKVEPKKSLNDKLKNTIQIGLNDRIAFVNHLFEGDSVNFNRVVSQLNTFESEKEAKKFISKIVKSDYDWSNKEAYEERFVEIVERKFM